VSTGKGFVNKLAEFKGAKRTIDGVSYVVEETAIRSRQLIWALSSELTPEQLKALEEVVTYAASKGVMVTLKVVK